MIQQFISKLSEREKNFLVVTIIIVVLSAFWVIYLGPGIDKLAEAKEGIELQKDSIKRDLRFLSYKDRILKESKVFAKYFTKDVPENDVINADFLSEIEQIATKDKVTLVKSNPSSSEKKKDFIEYFASLDCMGDFNDIVTFMHSINSTDELLKVVQFNITPKRGTPNDVKASMVVMKMVMPYDYSKVSDD